MPKKPKLRYLDLAEPVPGFVRNLDPKLTKRPESVLLADQVKIFILQTAESFTVDDPVQEQLADLRHELIDLFTSDNDQETEEYARIIELFSLLGFAAGYGEIQGGIAVRGKTESHVAFALTILIAENMKNMEKKLGIMDYSLQAGYIVARMGPDSVKRLASTARSGKSRLVFLQ